MLRERPAGRPCGRRRGLRVAAVVGMGLCAAAGALAQAAQPRRAGHRLPAPLGVFSHGPADLADVSGVVPLGNLSPGSGHVLAVDHMYLSYPVSVFDGAFACPVRAMGDGDLVMVLQSRVEGRTDPDFELSIAHSPELTSYLIHLHELSSRIQGLLDAVPDGAWILLGGADRVVLPGQLGAPAPLRVTAGELLGYSRSFSSSWDVGVIDTRRQLHFEGRGARRYPGVADYLELLGVDAEPPYAGHQTLNAACFVDYLQEPLRAAWAALLTSTPKGCGRAAWDLPGRLRGAWFNPALDTAFPPPLSELELGALSVIPDNLAPAERVQIGIGSGSPFAALDPNGSLPQLRRPFRVTADRTPGARVNPDPAQVGPDTGTVCYDLRYEDGGGPRYNTILLRMHSDRSVAVSFDPTPSDAPRCALTVLGEPDASWTTYVR